MICQHNSTEACPICWRDAEFAQLRAELVTARESRRRMVNAIRLERALRFINLRRAEYIKGTLIGSQAECARLQETAEIRYARFLEGYDAAMNKPLTDAERAIIDAEYDSRRKHTQAQREFLEG